MNKYRYIKRMINSSTLKLASLICGLILVISCEQDAKTNNTSNDGVTVKADSSSNDQETLLVTKDQFMLEEDGIKISLPDGYKRYSAVDYQTYLESNFKSDVLKYYKTRLKQLRNMDGTLYIYFDENSESTFTINSTPPREVSKDNAQSLLSMVRSDHDKVEEATNRTYEKVTAGYSEKLEVNIFKAIYRVSGADLKEPRFAHSYIISTKDKTLYINADTSAEFNFDPYIEKIQF